MSREPSLLEDDPEDLFEDAPCGYLSTRLDGTIIQVNRTFEAWTGLRRGDLLNRVRLQELLPPGSRIYFETHLAPLLQMQGAVREIALDIIRADASRLPTLINADLRRDAQGAPRVIRATIFDATERRRYEQELLDARRRSHATAEQLQRSLLSGTRPVCERLDSDVYYRAAIKGTEAGGDWYDAFWLEEGASVALVLGDVVGRGIGAAATMGQLRSAVRAFASTGLGPGGVLKALDGFSHRHGVGAMTTVIYAQLELDSGALRYVCAGHPPPIIYGPHSPAAFAWEGRSLPINTFDDLRERPEGQLTLQRGDTLLFYSDGLIEPRDRRDDGLTRLLQTVAEHALEPLDGVSAQIAAALRDASESDDVCLLATRLR